MDAKDLVRLSRVRIVRAESFGVFCVLEDRDSEVFVPFARVYDPPSSRLLPGETVDMRVPAWFAFRLDAGGIEERRSESRRAVPTGRLESLWLICKGGGMGGQAKVRDTSTHGLGIVVNRAGWRLLSALREAEASGATVGVSRTLQDQQRRARVVWNLQGGQQEIRFGLELTEPLNLWTD